MYGTNKVHYTTAGHGDHAIVLVHCWAGNLGLWREQVPALAPKARLLLVDLPGHGDSDKPHVEYSMDFFAGAVLAVMRDAHVEKATLIGHSMGVPVICRVYEQAPEKVAALVSVDGTLRRPSDTSAAQAQEFLAQFRGPDYRERTTNFLAVMFSTNYPAVRTEVVNELLKTPQYVMLGAMEGMFGTNQPDWNPHHVTVPVLSIQTSRPMWTDEYKAFARGLSSQTDYRSMDGVGHWLMLEKPEEFNTILTNMLARFELIRR